MYLVLADVDVLKEDQSTTNGDIWCFGLVCGFEAGPAAAVPNGLKVSFSRFLRAFYPDLFSVKQVGLVHSFRCV